MNNFKANRNSNQNGIKKQSGQKVDIVGVVDISDDELEHEVKMAAQPVRNPTRPRPNRRQTVCGERRDTILQMERCLSRSRSPVDCRRRVRSRSRSRSAGRRKSRNHGDRERKAGRSNHYNKERSSPIESFRVLDSRSYPEYCPPPEKRSSSPNEDHPLTVVSVLRMLSAMEDHLGSLGAKALHMLSQALAMEKLKPNAADELLMIEDNCVFLETVKEKLKGILIAEVLQEPKKVRVVKKLIQNIAEILTTKDAEKKKKQKSPMPFNPQLVTSKLTSALDQYGVRDLNTEDTNRLSQFFMLLCRTNHAQGLNFNEVPQRLGLQASSDQSYTPPIQDMDMTELFKEVQSQLAVKKQAELVAQPKANSLSLSDGDLQILLHNYKFLSSEEQVTLIGHMRQLEMLDPLRVVQLRKYLNITEVKGKPDELCSDYLQRVAYMTQRASNDDYDDDDDDDYNFNDLVVKVNESNARKDISATKPQANPISIKDTENVIDNLMGKLASNNNQPTTAVLQQQQQQLSNNYYQSYPMNNNSFGYFGVPPPPAPPQQQQQVAFGPSMVPAVGYENQMNPWTNGQQQQYYNNTPNYMPIQQQQQQYQQPSYIYKNPYNTK